MKNRKKTVAILIPLVITFSVFLVFYSRIPCKPDHASFWFILALGMALGNALTHFLGIFRKDEVK
jgi:hypothetical protein